MNHSVAPRLGEKIDEWVDVVTKIASRNWNSLFYLFRDSYTQIYTYVEFDSFDIHSHTQRLYTYNINTYVHATTCMCPHAFSDPQIWAQGNGR